MKMDLGGVGEIHCMHIGSFQRIKTSIIFIFEKLQG